MKITIDEDVVAKLKIHEGQLVNIDEVLLCLIVARGQDIYSIINKLVSRNILLLSKETSRNLMLNDKYYDLLDDILTQSDKNVSSTLDFKELAEKLQNLFPKGRKCDDCGVPKWSWRGNKTDVVKKLQKFFKIYGNYPSEDIIKATTNYVNRYKYDNKAMRILPYFIYKEVGDGVSDLATELESLDSNDDSELIRQYNYDSSEVVV